MVTQTRMQPFCVVELFDVTADLRIELSVTDTGTFALSLKRSQEALRVRLVLAGSGAVHAGHDTPGAQGSLVGVCGVLNAAIRMEYQARAGSACCDRALEGP